MRSRRYTNPGNSELDFKPFMNLMVVLIPMLLISAEFARISIIDIDLPKDRGSDPTIKQLDPSAEDKTNKLILTAIVTDSAITVGSKSGFLPSITYREFHEYVAGDDRRTFTVEHTPGAPVFHPDSKREMKLNERYEICLYATDTGNTIMHAWYTRDNELLLDAEGNPVSALARGDTVYALHFPQRMLVVSNMKEFQKRYLSAYDVLKSKLMAVKARYPHVEDSTDIIIASENEVIYDKIIKIMDVARESNFPDISIAKLRSS